MASHPGCQKLLHINKQQLILPPFIACIQIYRYIPCVVRLKQEPCVYSQVQLVMMNTSKQSSMFWQSTKSWTT